MVSGLIKFIIDERLLKRHKKNNTHICYDQHCRKKIKVGDWVISRMVSSGYNGLFTRKSGNKTRRVLYHLECAKELNII